MQHKFGTVCMAVAMLSFFMVGHTSATMQSYLSSYTTTDNDSEESTGENDESSGQKQRRNKQSSLNNAVHQVPKATQHEEREESAAKRSKIESMVPSMAEINRKLPGKRTIGSKTLDLFGENVEIFAKGEE